MARPTLSFLVCRCENGLISTKLPFPRMFHALANKKIGIYTDSTGVMTIMLLLVNKQAFLQGSFSPLDEVTNQMYFFA